MNDYTNLMNQHNSHSVDLVSIPHVRYMLCWFHSVPFQGDKRSLLWFLGLVDHCMSHLVWNRHQLTTENIHT